jgi:phosphatidylserine/phosphatidylglycerophosphate/cardiolipin synthase-like enzyme
MRRLNRAAPVWLLLALVLTGCPYLPKPGGPGGPPSSPALEIRTARLLTNNDAAIQSKLDTIRGASRSLDLMYYIYSDDYSSSVLTKALLDAARRGVKVRLLVDYATNYKHLDMFSMMEAKGREGSGSLEVRLYGRPTRNIVQDAAYMTIGCGRDDPGAKAPGQCGKEKLARIDQLFAGERIGDVPASNLDVSNLNVGNSGLFLSGFYAKQFEAMALAVTQGQNLDVAQLSQSAGSASADQKEALKKVGRLYWQSKTGNPFQRARADFELFLAFDFLGDQLNPVYDTFTRYLPAEKSFGGPNGQDWIHVTDFTHHKLLLADDARLQMGGRNVEDSYHMKPNELTEKYVFMDTDLYAELARGGETIGRDFDAVWSFTPMVATLAEVRQHAPNDFIANIDAFVEAEKECKGTAGPQAQTEENCRTERFAAKAKSLPERMAATEQVMLRNAGIYETRYTPHPEPSAESPEIVVDAGAALTYLENLPFNPRLPAAQRRRIYGAVNGREGESGKAIHEAWVRDMPAVCAAATADHPKTVVLHQAYFLPASNLTAAMGRLVDGKADCSHVTVKVLTNSIQTTDLSIVNLLARHWLKAFLEYYDSRTAPQRRARFEYHEYRPREGKANLSLHTKLSLLGDELLVGSANADVRSYYMDSNNVMLLRGAPQLLGQYSTFVEGILNDPARTRDVTESVRTTPREQLLAEDRQVLALILARYKVDQRLDPKQIATLETIFNQMLNDSYMLTREILAQPESQAARTFNARFEGI